MKADVKIRPLIKFIPSFKGTFQKNGRWFKYSIYFDWLIFTIDIDNY